MKSAELCREIIHAFTRCKATTVTYQRNAHSYYLLAIQLRNKRQIPTFSDPQLEHLALKLIATSQVSDPHLLQWQNSKRFSQRER